MFRVGCFAIGMVGCVVLVIPIAAYQLFSVLFEKDRPRRNGSLSVPPGLWMISI